MHIFTFWIFRCKKENILLQELLQFSLMYDAALCIALTTLYSSNFWHIPGGVETFEPHSEMGRALLEGTLPFLWASVTTDSLEGMLYLSL